MNWLMVVGVIFLAIWFVREYMAVFVPENTALLLVDAWGEIRKLKSGLRLKNPLILERPVEKPSGGSVSLRSGKLKFAGVYEGKGFTIKLTTTFVIRPIFDFLEKYIEFEDSERNAAIIERVRNILLVIIVNYESREGVKKDLEQIGKQIDKEFSDVNGEAFAGLDLEHFYGVNVQQFIVDHENPTELVEAQNRLEAQQKENERQKSESDNFGKMAENLVHKSKELGSPISTEVAMEKVLVIHGKASRETKVVDLGPGAQKVAEGLAGIAGSLGKGLIDAVKKIADKKEEGKDGKE